MVSAFLLEGVALGVVAEGALELAPGLEGVAEREAELDAITRKRRIVGHRGDHLLDLLPSEGVRLRVRKAPVRVAVVRFQPVGIAVERDGAVDVAVRLVHVGSGDREDVVLGVRLGECFEAGDRVAVAADAAACGTVQ